MNLFIVAVRKGALHAAAVKRLPSSVLPFAYIQETVDMIGQGPPHPRQALYTYPRRSKLTLDFPD